MNDQKTSENETLNKSSLTTLSVVILVVFVVLVGGIYWWVSKKGKGEVVFPAGINYTGTETTPAAQTQKPTFDFASLAAGADWTEFVSTKAQYTFQYPPQMLPVIIPGDANDSVTFDIADVPAQYNLMVLYETISNYDPKLVGKQEEFVRNYWRNFDGLKGMDSIEAFTNEKGLKGWKVRYVSQNDKVGTDNYFFAVPGKTDKIIHVNNIFPQEGETLFNRLLNSLDYKK